MARRPTIALIGAGNLARALGPALRGAGYTIDELISRRRAAALARHLGARAATMESARLTADVIWLCVSDSAIRSVAESLALRADWRGRVAFHSSGALASDELAALRRRGASVASLHPMMTFVRRGAPSLKGIGFAAEGDRAALSVARRIVGDVGGHFFTIRKSAKTLYHAWGAFGSPALIMELALAERIARAAGIHTARARKTIQPIVRRTIDNYFAHGAAAALSGPLVRGDLDTVRHHLRELARVPGARKVYVALIRSAFSTLPIARQRELKRLLR